MSTLRTIAAAIIIAMSAANFAFAGESGLSEQALAEIQADAK